MDTTFLDTIWNLQRGMYGEVRTMRDGRVESSFLSTPDAAMRFAKEMNEHGYDAYFGVLPRLNMRGRAEDCTPTAHVLWADFDAKNFRSKMGHSSALASLSSVSPSPQIVVDSAHGYHAYWLLDEEYPFEDVQTVMRGIESLHGADHCSDQPRVLRVPDTINFKPPAGVVRIVKLDLLAPSPYSLESFYEYFKEGMRRTYRGTSEWRRGVSVVGEWITSPSDAPKFGEGQRNGALFRLATAMVHKGIGRDVLRLTLMQENAQRCVPPLPIEEVENIASSAERYL